MRREVWPYRGGAHIRLHHRRQRPALRAAQRQPDLRAGQRFARTRSDGMINAFNELLPFWQRGQSSALSFPQKAFIFFRSTRIAAVSASALSLRRSSRSSSAMRFLSARA
jgi:hypothetical protein